MGWGGVGGSSVVRHESGTLGQSGHVGAPRSRAAILLGGSWRWSGLSGVSSHTSHKGRRTFRRGQGRGLRLAAVWRAEMRPSAPGGAARGFLPHWALL